MDTRIPHLIVTGTLALTAACNPQGEPGTAGDLEAASADARAAQAVEVPDSLAFSTVNLNADSVIEQNEFDPWIEGHLARAAEDAGVERAAVSDTTGGNQDVGLSRELGLTLTESEWENSGRYLFSRTQEPVAFEDWDADGDGRLDPYEALAGLGAQGENRTIETGPIQSEEQLSDVLFRLWDLDGNGTLEPDEYRGGVATWWP